jgi:hypothetical protein
MPKAKKKAATEETDYDPGWRPLPEIAAMFGLSEERCRQFVKQGIWERREDGMLRVRTCLHMYQLFLSNPSWFRENFP